MSFLRGILEKIKPKKSSQNRNLDLSNPVVKQPSVTKNLILARGNSPLNKNLNKIFTNDRTLMLAYDHGLEHGPSKDFNLVNSRPEFIFGIAEKAKINALITQIGVAEKYSSSYNIPLIVKLNGKTSLTKEALSRQVCSVERALKLNPVGVGFTIYPGSYYEGFMFNELSKIIEKSHNAGLPVLVWSYPRNKEGSIDEDSTDNIAYAARIALELGADIVKLKYNGDFEGFKWVTHNSGRTRVVVAGGYDIDRALFLRNVEDVLKAGAGGVTVGRNVWQDNEPLKMLLALKKIIFEKKSADEVIKEMFN